MEDLDSKYSTFEYYGEYAPTYRFLNSNNIHAYVLSPVQLFGTKQKGKKGKSLPQSIYRNDY